MNAGRDAGGSADPHAGGNPDPDIRVVVADDQEIVRTGLRMILDAQPGIVVVGVAADGRRAVELARRLRPDVCLIDIRMPVMDGIQATLALAGPGVADPLAVVVITTFDLDEYVYAALRAGARGFLLKDAGPDLLAQAVHAAARGDALIAPNVTARLLATFAGSGPAPVPVQPVEALTDREEQVLATVAGGRTNSEIAADLHISLSTVKTHIASLMAKLGARNRVEIALWAYQTGRVDVRRSGAGGAGGW
ncbi:Two component transcriptional regulator, LuxR family [Frankia sp. Hr75.2]|nr:MULTISPECIES: response regulator transcription factor [Parafrankia]CAI7973539.1 Two component transcriptional regulator, LuxR family [Frankia sp. Hr75.2]SQD95059.1 Two component transcriptional regulator, LuxR family [Parafrankia sp. Ea1.12]